MLGTSRLGESRSNGILLFPQRFLSSVQCIATVCLRLQKQVRRLFEIQRPLLVNISQSGAPGVADRSDSKRASRATPPPIRSETQIRYKYELKFQPFLDTLETQL